MDNTESLLFTSIIPLRANGFFAPPQWGDVLKFNFAVISFIADTNCNITIYNSPDQVNNTSVQTISVLANSPLNTSIPIISRYIKIRVDNAENSAQNIFSLQTIYKNQNLVSIPILNQQIFNGNTGVNGTSSIINSSILNKSYTFFGSVDNNTDLIVQTSPDGINWYDTQYNYTSSSSNFGFNVSLISQYLRIKSSADVNCICYVNSI